MLRFEFTSQEYLRDPAAHLARLRAAGPVVEVHFPIVARTWITTTSELAGRVLKDSETFIMRKDGRPAGLRCFGWSLQDADGRAAQISAAGTWMLEHRSLVQGGLAAYPRARSTLGAPEGLRR